MLGFGQMGVLFEQRKGLLPCLLEQLRVADQAGRPKLRRTPLPYAEKFSRPPDVQILFRDHKTVVGLHQRL